MAFSDGGDRDAYKRVRRFPQLWCPVSHFNSTSVSKEVSILSQLGEGYGYVDEWRGEGAAPWRQPYGGAGGWVSEEDWRRIIGGRVIGGLMLD